MQDHYYNTGEPTLDLSAITHDNEKNKEKKFYTPKKCQKKIHMLLLNRQINPQTQYSLHSLPNDMTFRVNKLSNQILELMINISTCIQSRNYTCCEISLDKLSKRVLSHNSTPSEQWWSNKDLVTFTKLGGMGLLLKLFYCIMELHPVTPSSSTSSSRVLVCETGIKIINDLLVLLRELCYTFSDASFKLCQDDGVLIYLFHLMSVPQIFDAVIGLTEEVLSLRSKTFDLSQIEEFHSLVNSFSSRRLASFCRVIALLIFEPEDRHLMEQDAASNHFHFQSVGLLQLRRRRMSHLCSSLDRNHALLLSLPCFLPRLVTLLAMQRLKAPGFDFDNSFDFQSSPSILIDLLGIFKLDPLDDWNEVVFAADLVSNSSFHTLINNLQIGPHQLNPELIIHRESVRRVKAMILAPHQVEVLFVLCTLLGGRRKLDVRNELSELGLIEILHHAFDSLQWNEIIIPHSERIHGSTCECNPESALRVQLLRLVHNFCDGESKNQQHHQCLLSNDERYVIEQMKDNPQYIIHFNDSSTSSPGLLMKIIHIYIQQKGKSIYKFWLASCVESFLRHASCTEQYFIAQTPLLNHLIHEILCGQLMDTKSNNLQTAFDLLSELIKANSKVFQLFCQALDDQQFQQLMEIVMENLVDSNVFIRSMLLSCMQEDPSFSMFDSSFSSSCFSDAGHLRVMKSLCFYSRDILKKLLHLIHVKNISHENICCLNTVLLLFLHVSSSTLDTLLHEFDKKESKNLKDLLWFWKEYYSIRGKDRKSLEMSCQLPFSQWKNIVQLLSYKLCLK